MSGACDLKAVVVVGVGRLMDCEQMMIGVLEISQYFYHPSHRQLESILKHYLKKQLISNSKSNEKYQNMHAKQIKRPFYTMGQHNIFKF